MFVQEQMLAEGYCRDLSKFRHSNCLRRMWWNIAAFWKTGKTGMTLTKKEKGTYGLCSRCTNAASCIYRVMFGFNTLFCEFFEDNFSQEAQKPRLWCPEITQKKTDTYNLKTLPENFKGLCINCRHRFNCDLPKSAGGVWHCDKYEWNVQKIDALKGMIWLQMK